MAIRINALRILIVLLILSAIMGIQSVAAERYFIVDKHGLADVEEYLLAPQPPILQPINNPDGDGDYRVDWNNVPSATSYLLQEDDNSDFTTPTFYNTTVSQQDIIGQPYGTWYYQVLARNNSGNSSWSNIVSVSIIHAPVLSPIDNTDGNGDYLIDWSDIGEATSYRLEEDDNSGFTSPLVRFEGATSGYQITGQSFGTWHYRVLASNVGGNSPWSNTESVSVILAPPAGPTLNPISNPDGNGDYLVNWNDVAGASSYRLEEDDNSGFISPTIHDGILDSQFSVAGQPGGTWYYRVLAVNAFGDSPWSNTELVSVIPDAPVLLPIDNVDGNGDYLTDWSDVPGASSYRLEEANNSGFISSTIRYEGVASQFEIFAQQVGTWYYRVLASNAGGDSPWSNTQSVIVAQNPLDSPVLEPISNPDGNGDYLIEWNDVPDATSYRLEEANNLDFISSTVRYEGATSQYNIIGQPTGVWYYRVWASNAGGHSAWSNTESVNVVPEAPVLLPIDNVDGNGDYLVDWNDVTGAQYYRLEEADNTSFISSTVRYEGVASQSEIFAQQVGTWYYRVLASNTGGDSPWSNIEQVIVEQAAPESPILSPIDNPDGNGDYLIGWSNVASAISYRLEEDDNSSFASPTIRYEGADNQYPVTSQQAGTWYYRVRATNGGGNSLWSNIESVSVIPQAPTLFPIENTDGNGDYLIDWSDVTGATRYQLEEDDNENFISPSVRFVGTASQYQISGQQVGTWYYRVLAGNAGGDSSPSNVESVIVNQGPQESPILYPISNLDGNGVYLVDWSVVIGATSYRLEEDDNENFTSPTIRFEGTVDQYQVSGQQAGTWYYRVLASNQFGNSPWSNTESVSVIPNAPVLSPIDNPDNNGHYLVDWNDVAGAAGYRLEEDDNAGFSSPTVRYAGTASQYLITSQPAGTWYYRVLARNAGGDGPWSNTQSVVVVPTPLTNTTFLPSIYSARLYPYGVQVLPASYNYISHDTLFVIGEVLNNTRDHIASIKVTVNFYDAGNHLVGTKYDYLWPLSLPAYEKGCFNIDMDNIPPGWTSYRFEISSYIISGTSRGLTIFDDNGSYNSLNGNYEIIGFVRNGGSQLANGVAVSGTLYNAAGVPVGCEYRQVNNPSLNPGQTSSFTLNFLGYFRDYADVISYKLRLAGVFP